MCVDARASRIGGRGSTTAVHDGICRNVQATDCCWRPVQTHCTGRDRTDLCWSGPERDGYTFAPWWQRRGGFLYEHLADELGQAIDRGALRAGDRLPSVRRLAQERSVSVSTVLEAYLRLENAGLIEVRPKSGHFVRRRAR